LEGYGDDPREPAAWHRNRVREAIGTAVWAYQVGDETFELIRPRQAVPGRPDLGGDHQFVRVRRECAADGVVRPARTSGIATLLSGGVGRVEGSRVDVVDPELHGSAQQLDRIPACVRGSGETLRAEPDPMDKQITEPPNSRRDGGLAIRISR